MELSHRMITTKSTESESEQKHWKERLRDSVSSITSTTGISVSEAGEQSECCCCINWYHDRQSKMRLKKQMKNKNKKIKTNNNNNNKYNNYNNMNMFNFKGQKLLIEIPRSDAIKLKNIFKQFDSDNNGYLSQSDLGLAMKQLGFDMTHSTKKLNAMFDKADLDNDGRINFSEFALAIIKKAPYLFASPTHDELKFVFDIFDVDKDGLISIQDLRSSFESQGIILSKTEITQMISNIIRSDKRERRLSSSSLLFGIKFKEFKQMMINYDEDDHIGLFSFNTGYTAKSPPPPPDLHEDDDDDHDYYSDDSHNGDNQDETVELVVNAKLSKQITPLQ